MCCTTAGWSCCRTWGKPRAQHLAQPARGAGPPVTPTTTNDAVAAMFHERTELHALAVVDGTQPVALINRQQFMNHYATLYFRRGARAQALPGVCQHRAARGGARLRCGAAHGHPHIARPALPERRLHRDGQQRRCRPGHGATNWCAPWPKRAVKPPAITRSLSCRATSPSSLNTQRPAGPQHRVRGPRRPEPLQAFNDPLRLLAGRPDDPGWWRPPPCTACAARPWAMWAGTISCHSFPEQQLAQRCKTSSG